MADETIESREESKRWHSKAVTYWAGRWDQLSNLVPEFKIEDFRAEKDTPANPYLKTVVRLPRTQFEQPVPAGVVSNIYTLAQHKDVAQKCFDGIRLAGLETTGLRCELGLTELGEWMNFRVYFPEKFNYTPADGKEMGLRIECFNSVDGSSRLVILLGWLRFVCTNGMIIGETKTELRDAHDRYMDLRQIPVIICEGMEKVHKDLLRLKAWEKIEVKLEHLQPWVNKEVTEKWGKKASCRVFHICSSGYDVEIIDPFALGEATDKPVKKMQKVPGAPEKAENLYDVSQTLSWVATGRNNAEERLEWQSKIPQLVESLAILTKGRNGHEAN